MRNSNTNHTNVTLNSTSRGCKAEPYPFSASAVVQNLFKFNKLGNGETCQGLRHWRLLSNLKKNFSKPVRNDMKDKIPNQVRNDSVIVVQNNIKDKNRNKLINLSTYRLIDFKKVAFTLAETLITLGIIGVVAAITIPGLINHYKAQRLRTQFLESYSIVQQVFKQMETDDVSLDPTTYSFEEYPKVFGKYLKGAMDCNISRKKPCFDFRKDHYKNLQGENMPAGFNGLLNDGSFLLPNGSLLLIENGGADWGSQILVTVDLNGFGNPPDKLGIDVFIFQLIDGELKTVGDKGTSWVGDYLCNANSTNQWNGVSCAQKAKTNTDYFKEMIKKVK